MILENFGEAFALICAILWASAIIIFKQVGETMSANTLNLVKNLIGLSLLVPTAIFVEGALLPQLNVNQWLILIVSGYFGIAVADTWYLQALRNLGAGRTAIVASLYSPFVVLLSIIFLHEQLAVWQWLGFILVLVGILIVVYQRSYQSIVGKQLWLGVGLAASSVFLTAAGVVAMKPLLDHNGFFWMVSLRMLAGIIGMFFFLAARRKLVATYHEIRFDPHNWLGIVAASVLGAYLALIFWLAGFKYADASVASVLNETANIFIVLMAWLFLSEGLGRRKILGVCLTFAGVLIFLGVLS